MLIALLALALVGALQDSTHLVVVATTDVHGRAIGWDYTTDTPVTGGLARVATVVDSLRASHPGQVIVVDAGNVLQGSPFATYVGRIAPRDPHPVVEALNLVGYDAGTPALHDFDLGFPEMHRAFAGAAFPYVSANLVSVDGDTLLYPAFTVLRRGGVRIAVTGFADPDVMMWSGAKLHSSVRVLPIAEVGARTLQAARTHADVVVALVHAGLERGAAALTAGPVRPDVVVVGSATRAAGDSTIGGVRVVHPRPDAAQVAVVHLWLERAGGTWRTRRTRVNMVSVDRATPATRVTSRLASDQAAARLWAQTPIGRAVADFPAEAGRAGATALIDFVNRVQRERTGAALSATPAYNAAGLAGGLIRRVDVLAVYPFDNTLLAVKITGAQLKEYLEYAARYYRVDPVGRVTLNDSMSGQDFDVVGGAQYDVDLRAAVGSRIRNLVVGGNPVQASDSFTMAVNSQRYSGVDGYPWVPGAPVVYDGGEYIRDLLMREIERHEMLNPADFAENGWHVVPATAASAVRSLFNLPDDTPPPPRPPHDSIVARVLAIGDLHGRFDAVPTLKTLMDSLARACGCGILRLGTGDATPAGIAANAGAGRASLELLSRLGLAAVGLGERELDWPRDTLRRRTMESEYPWLAANIFDSATGRRPEWTTPYRIVPVGGLHIALIGYISVAAGGMLSAEHAAGLRFAERILPLKAVLDEVRAARPDLTLLLVHADAAEAGRLISALPRGSVDLVVTGHAADPAAARVGGMPIVGAGTDGAALAVADIVRTSAGGLEIRPQLVPISAELRADSALALLAERFRRQVDSLAGQPVASMKLPLDRSDRRIGQLVADARRNALRADIGFVSDADLHAGLAAGPVGYRELLQVQPAGRTLVVVTLRGAQLLDVFEQILREERLWVYAAGVQVRYDSKRPAGRRVRRTLLSDGRELRRDGVYRVAVDDALLRPPGGLSALNSGSVERSGMLDVDALVLYLQRLSPPIEVPDRPGFVSP